jgi:branched-chain amino acid transport system permease protein
LGFAEAFRKTIENLDFFNGPKGISISSAAGFSRIPGTVISSGTVAYWVTLLALILTVMLVQRLRASPIGRAWVAIRENEIAASAMGIPVVSLKLLAFALSAAIASAAGVLYDAREGFISPALCQFQISVMILAMVILGGLGNTYGALVGAALLYLAPEYMKLLPSLVHNTPALSFIPSFITDALQHLEDYRLLIFGILMVVVMLYRPQGLLGTARRRVEIKEGT